MNERIRELLEQATTIEVLSGRGFDETQYTDRFSKEKFAELIVRDVVDTVKRTQIVSPDFEWAILNNYELEVKE